MLGAHCCGKQRLTGAPQGQASLPRGSRAESAEEGVEVRSPVSVGVLVRENLEPGLKVILN